MKKTFKNRGNTEHKLPDGKTIWESRSPAVVAVVLGIYKDNIFALTEKRSSTMQDEPGKLAIVSGYLDYDETGWEAVTREIYEETGFDVDKYKNQLIFDNDQQPWFVNTDPRENRQNVSLTYILIYDFSKGLPREVEKFQDSEIDSVRWMPVERVFDSRNDWAFNHQNRIMDAVEKFQKYLI
jgi:8-oxo-dGTP pyrophosphatase MutT (NUDIX family)